MSRFKALADLGLGGAEASCCVDRRTGSRASLRRQSSSALVVRLPALLLLGGDSPAFFEAAIEKVHAALPDSKVLVMPGQQHTAINTAPALYLLEVQGCRGI